MTDFWNTEPLIYLSNTNPPSGYGAFDEDLYEREEDVEEEEEISEQI